MPFQPELYPPDWRVQREKRIAEAGGKCQSCGVADRSISENAKKQPFMVHLQIAHKEQYQTWREDAETMVLCQKCHRRYDRQFIRRSGTRRNSPIGYASIYTEHNGRKVLVEMTRTLDELRDVTASLPLGSDIEVQLIVILAVVGNGHYHKQSDGTFRTIAEHSACVGLAPLLK